MVMRMSIWVNVRNSDPSLNTMAWSHSLGGGSLVPSLNRSLNSFNISFIAFGVVDATCEGDFMHPTVIFTNSTYKLQLPPLISFLMAFNEATMLNNCVPFHLNNYSTLVNLEQVRNKLPQAFQPLYLRVGMN